MKRQIFLILILIIICSIISGCDISNPSGASKDSESQIDGDVFVKEETIYTYHSVYKDISFASDEQKSEWRENLIYLLENKGVLTDGKYVYPFPDRPGIEAGAGLALFDVNIDGVPELIVSYPGGSAGNVFYVVYDIKTGFKLGYLHSGTDGSWCIYLNTESGKFEAIGEFSWREGWSVRHHYIEKADIITLPDGTKAIDEQKYFHIRYYIEHTESGAERYGSQFYMNGSGISIDKYLSEYNSFFKTYVRISQTELNFIGWYDDMSAESLVDILLCNEQMFIAPQNTN